MNSLLLFIYSSRSLKANFYRVNYIQKKKKKTVHEFNFSYVYNITTKLIIF